jgi:hypothetical protein
MMRNWKAAVAATAVALLAVAAAPAAEAAMEPPPSQKPAGRWMTCGGAGPVSDGRIVGGRIFSEIPASGRGFLSTRIQIKPCVKPGRLDEFALVMFGGPEQKEGIFQTAGYRSLNADGTYTFTTPATRDGIRAVCLSSRETRRVRTSKRLDCLRVTWSSTDRRQVLDQHLPTTDPLVQRTATFVFGTDPNCAGCTW